MAYVAPVEESLFFIENCTSIPRLCAAGAFPLGDGDAAAILTAAGQFAAEVLAPIDDALDRVGAQFADGVVTMSPGHRDAYRGYAEGGWAGLTLAEEWGGQALPVTLNVACLEYWHAASMGFAMGNLLCTGAAETIEAFAPPMATFKRGRDFAAWLGLVPRQHTTGGKPRLGRTSKMGQRDIRRLLIIGAMTVVRWAVRKGAAKGSWLARMLAKKPRLVVAIALANKMARSVWAMLSKGEEYRGSALAPA